MDVDDQPAAVRLLEILRQFRRVGLHKSTFEGYNSSMIRVLFIVRKGCCANAQGLTVSEISNQMEVTPPTVTQLIKSLEAEGLVVRINDQADRRVVRVLLTEEGRTFMQKLIDSRAEKMNQLSEYLGEEKTKQLVDLLEQILQFLNQNEKENM